MNYFPYYSLFDPFTNKWFVVYDFSCECLQLPFWAFLLLAVFFLVIGHLAVSIFLCVVSFILIVPRIFFLDYLMTVFIGVPHLDAVVTFCYIFRYVCNFSISPVFYLWPYFLQIVTVFPANCAGTLVLGFYIKVFLYYCTFIQFYFN